ncbi:MAG: hypothetical protein B7733_24365 [Myxococcales bacterium FL481]|nr:MAG: hypothetical protein B7733_24365 [Myxococcales bacterium FL481]
MAPYDGDDEIVLEAQAHFRTGLEFHTEVIWRTCTPFDGVCHNSKEYPDLRTPASFAATFGAPCNVQPGDFTSVYDGCERPGDRVHFDGGGLESADIEIAYVEYRPGESGGDTAPADGPGLHIHLAHPVATDRDEFWGSANFVRRFVADGDVHDTVFESFRSTWRIVDDGRHVVAEVAEYQVDRVQALLEVGIVEGDANRNGVFGARETDPVSLLEPGAPEHSYLIARMRGELDGHDVPGSRMPLANQPFTVPEMLAFFCLVEGFEGLSSAALADPIDYRNCSYADDPESLNLLGDGVTWEKRIRKIFEFNCGGCHSGAQPQAGLDLVSEGVYERLFVASQQSPELQLIEPGDAEASYLYLKLINDPAITGNPMPFNPLTGDGRLTEGELGDVLTWIENGAIEDE